MLSPQNHSTVETSLPGARGALSTASPPEAHLAPRGGPLDKLFPLYTSTITRELLQLHEKDVERTVDTAWANLRPRVVAQVKRLKEGSLRPCAQVLLALGTDRGGGPR